MSNIFDAAPSAKPIKGTRYSLGEFVPTVSLGSRKIYILVLNDTIVDRGSKADLMQCAKSVEGTPLGTCHARYSEIAGL